VVKDEEILEDLKDSQTRWIGGRRPMERKVNRRQEVCEWVG
jgi:hypothetical protein